MALFGAISAVSLLTAETVNMRKSDRLRNITRLSNCSVPLHPEVLNEGENRQEPPLALTPSEYKKQQEEAAETEKTNKENTGS